MSASGANAWIQAHSAGGVVVRQAEGNIYFLAIRPAGTDRWQLPKGTIDRGETPAQAAVREVREEGGVDVDLAEQLGSVRYFFHQRGRRIVKTVDFFLMRFRTGNPDEHDREVDEALWFPVSELKRLTFRDEQNMVGLAVERLAGTPDQRGQGEEGACSENEGEGAI